MRFLNSAVGVPSYGAGADRDAVLDAWPRNSWPWRAAARLADHLDDRDAERVRELEVALVVRRARP